MVRFLASTALTLLGNAAGLIIAALLLPDFHIQPLGFVVSVLFFTAVEVLLSPFIFKMSLRYVPALRGGIALVTTFVGLVLTALFTNGLSIDGVTTWVIAPLIIWVSAVLAGVVLPMFMFKKILENQKEARQSDDISL